MDKQCNLTKSWITVKGKISTIVSERNRPNELGIKYQFGKKAGQLKKNKVLTEKEIEDALSKHSV